MIVFRRELGEALRARRQSQGRTLRQVSSAASVSLGYLSEVEHGEKEASSELLSAICHALDTPLSEVLDDVARRVAVAESVNAAIALPVTSVTSVVSLGDNRSEVEVEVGVAAA